MMHYYFPWGVSRWGAWGGAGSCWRLVTLLISHALLPNPVLSMHDLGCITSFTDRVALLIGRTSFANDGVLGVWYRKMIAAQGA
jgi:hypothetical protein